MGLLGLFGSPAPRPPADRLRIAQLADGRALLQATSGAPPGADALAYEPTQRLLAVSAPQAHAPRAAAWQNAPAPLHARCSGEERGRPPRAGARRV